MTSQKNSMSSLDLHFLVGEMQIFVGSKIDKVFQPTPSSLSLLLHIPSSEKKAVLISLPNYILFGDRTLCQSPEESEESPDNLMSASLASNLHSSSQTNSRQGSIKSTSGFLSFLRKNLDNTRIKAIKQYESERIVIFEIEKPGKEKKVFNLLIELFGKGNLILCDESYNTLLPLCEEHWRNREIIKGKPYIFPSRGINLFTLTQDEFKKIVHDSKRENIVKTLAVEFLLGGKYAESICENADIDKNKPSLSSKEIENLFSALISLKNKKEHESYNSYFLQSYLSLNGLQEQKESKSMLKYKKIIEMQIQKLTELELEIDENNKKADTIYANYQFIESLLQELNTARKKYSLHEIKDKLKGHKKIKSVDVKNAIVEVDL